MSISIRLKLALACVGSALLVSPAVAPAAEAPAKQIVTGHFGWNVDKTKEREGAPQAQRDVCTVESNDECQPASPNGGPGGFEYPEGIAVDNDPGSPQEGDLYIADRGNHRVQELSANGVFVSMFGWDVNKTKIKEGAPQAQRNVCTAASNDECGPGTEGTAPGAPPGQFGRIESIAVDQGSGDVYVAEVVSGGEGGAERVEKFSPDGTFLWEIGSKVNEKTGGDLCTQAEEAQCTGPEPHAGGIADTEPFAFGFAAVITVGPKGVLYVGEEHRVKEIDAEGTVVGEISLTGISDALNWGVSALAVDESGAGYLVYGAGGGNYGATIRKFSASGAEVKEAVWPLTLSARQTPTATRNLEHFEIHSLAIDSSGRLAVSESETLRERIPPFTETTTPFGSLLNGSSGHLISEFSDEFPSFGLIEGAAGGVFGGNGDLYGVGIGAHQVIAYRPVPVGEALTGSVACAQSTAAAHESDVTFECELRGEANPWAVPDTQAWFQWGATPSLGSETPKRTVCSALCGSSPTAVTPAVLEGLRPNSLFYDRLVGGDEFVQPPETLVGETVSFRTESVPPRIVGAPSASVIEPASAVLFGRLNPENTSTRYEFQYAPASGCESLAGACPGLAQTATRESSAYAAIATSLEASGLQPATAYRYRLVASNAGGTALNEAGTLPLPEGEFQTALAPAPQVATGAASAVGTTTAVISGSVNPDGGQATYAFELGVYAGGETQYGVVLSAPAGLGSTPVAETFALSGLQPGTTYAYRITLSSGYVKNEAHTVVGATETFTTAGLPAVLAEPPTLPLLAIPAIAFPAEAKPVTVKGLTRSQKLAGALKACKHKPKKQWAACEQQAHKQYGAVKKKKKKK